MTQRKERLTVTVDPELIAAGNEAVAAGRAESLSGWVNQALAERVVHEQRMRALAQAVAAYESEFGEISPDEVAAQKRADRQEAVVVRGQPDQKRKPSKASPRKRARGAA